MTFPHPGWATASFYGGLGCIALTILICAFLFCCYFPGGRLRRDVIDIGELSKYNLAARPGEYEEYYEDDRSQSEYTMGHSDGGENPAYYEMPPTDTRPQRSAIRPIDPEDVPVRRGIQMAEI